MATATDEVQFVSASDASSRSDHFDVDRPDDVQEGDVLIMTIGGTANGADGMPYEQDDRWTRIDVCSQDDNGEDQCEDDGQDLFLQMYYTVATADEPAEYDVTAGGNSVASITAYRGVDTDDPIESSEPLVDDGDYEVSTCPSTDGVDGGMLVCGVTQDGQLYLENHDELTLRSVDENPDSTTSVLTESLHSGGDTDRHEVDIADPTGNKDITMAAVLRPSSADGGDGTSGSGAGTNTLVYGENDELQAGEHLESANGDYRLYFQGSDGNLVLRDTGTGDALWASHTNGDGGTELNLQGDGNLVMYTDDGEPVWASHTAGSGADELVLEDDGALVLYDDGEEV